ncbi:MAG: AAA family ATPase [Eubacterium sp.]|nr:AAA family ATPase [Eubacterium sp.]
MSKKNVVIAEADENYISTLEFLLTTREEKGISLELITSTEYLQNYMQTSRKIDCLIIDEALMTDAVLRQQIGCTFILSEEKVHDGMKVEGLSRFEYLDKYSSVQEIFHKIIGKLGLPTDDRVAESGNSKKSTSVIVVNSQLGGIGRTTVSFALAQQLSKLNRSVLYMSTDFLQKNHFLAGITDIMGSEMDRMIKARDKSFIRSLEQMVKHLSFDYLLPWSGSRAAIDINEEDYIYMIDEIKSTGLYDFIILDTQTGLDVFTLTLMSKCDHILEVIDQTLFCRKANDCFKSELRATEKDKISYICNRYNHRKDGYVQEEVVEFIEERTIDRDHYLRAVEVADMMKVTAMTLV